MGIHYLWEIPENMLYCGKICNMSKNGKVLLPCRIMMATYGCHGNNVYKLCFNDIDMFIKMCLMRRNK